MGVTLPKDPRFNLRAAVLEELDRVLESAEFRQSEQSKRLLRYLVEQSLEGRLDLLRERAIGTALFGREAGYDTNESPIVRVRANEIRKRLAKYYQERRATAAVLLEVPAGGYRVEFHHPDVQVSSVQLPQPPRKQVWMWPAAVLLACAIAATVWLWRPADVVSEFWRPAMDSRAPVILCTGHPVVYRFSSEYMEKKLGVPADHFRAQTDILPLGPDEILTGRDIVPVPDQYVGLGSADCVARIQAWLAGKHKDSEIRFGNDVSFTDFRRAPAVLIGAFQNRWTLAFTRNLRFVFTTINRVPSIRDSQTGKTWSLPQLKDNGQTDLDYLIISRVFRPETGQFLIMAAPITQYGAKTAGEILTSAALLSEALKNVKDWRNRNLQLLYQVPVIGQSGGTPKLLAVHSW